MTEESEHEHIERFTESLPVELTEAQVAERANRAAHRLAERDRAEAELKAYVTQEKSKIARLEAEFRHLSNEVRERTTYQCVPCERRYMYEIGRVVEIRTDTGAVINQRSMTSPERQRDLFNDPENNYAAT